MANPTSQMMNVSAPLTDFSVAAMQEDVNFLLTQCGPIQPVKKQVGKYYVYDDGDYNRIVGELRGSSSESAGGGWALSTDTYDCKRWSVHKDTDTVDAANADEAVANVDEDAITYLNNQARMRGDYLLGANVLAASVWHDDLDGTAAAGTEGTDCTYWNDSGGDPQADVILYASRARSRCGFLPNTMMVGSITHARILSNAAVRAAVKVTDMMGPLVIQSKLANYFGVEKYLIGGAFKTTSAEGLADTFSSVLDSKAAWLGYVSPVVGLRQMTAFRVFGFTGDGANNGVLIRTMEIPEKTSVRHEIETFWDVKVVNSDAGCFFDSIVE